MATYYIHECGHSSLCDPWGKGPDRKTSGLCFECRKARVGQIIEFVRYGKPPASGVSWNHRDRTAEEGVSVYEVVNGQPQHVGWHFGITDRPAYAGKGEIVGWGSDGEPLVKVQSIRRAKNFDK
jgi:hypothetical protein